LYFPKVSGIKKPPIMNGGFGGSSNPEIASVGISEASIIISPLLM